jgi:CubicO group peptidase (beta-lactamase class C family)
MEGYVERGELPGFAWLLSRAGEVQVQATGALSFQGAALERDAIFRIASMSKAVTAAAAMILVEECKLRLDDPVDELLPELADRQVLTSLDAPLTDTVPAQRAITTRDLLTFRMGFGLSMDPPGTHPIQRATDSLQLGQGAPRPKELPEPDEWIRRFGTLPLIHQPGEKWMYHTGSDVLGVMIARAAGTSFDGFLRERLFGPLGMKDTGFSVPADRADRFTASYATVPQTGKLWLGDEAASGQWSQPPAFPSGGAGLVSTVDDFHAFGQMLLNGGRHGTEQILSRASAELMTSDHLTDVQKAVSGLVPGYFASRGWGFGVSVVTRRLDWHSVGTYGWDGGLGTSWRNDPKEGLVGILLTQRAWTSPVAPRVCRDFWTLAYQALED